MADRAQGPESGEEAGESEQPGDSPPQLGSLLGILIDWLPLHVQTGLAVAIGKARDDVEVDVRNELAGGHAVILEHIEGLSAGDLHDGASDPRKDFPDRGCRFIGKLVERFGRLFRNDERVPFAEGVDIEDCDAHVILVYLLAGDFPTNDPAENRVAHGDMILMRPAAPKPVQSPDGSRVRD